MIGSGNFAHWARVDPNLKKTVTVHFVEFCNEKQIDYIG
jgi:hypothetical protein